MIVALVGQTLGGFQRESCCDRHRNRIAPFRSAPLSHPVCLVHTHILRPTGEDLNAEQDTNHVDFLSPPVLKFVSVSYIHPIPAFKLGLHVPVSR